MILVRIITSPVLIVIVTITTVLLSIAGGLVWICTGESWTIQANYPDWR